MTAESAHTPVRSHLTAPTQFVSANRIRYAYRRFGAESGTPLISSSTSAAAWITGIRRSPTGWPRTVRSFCSTTLEWQAQAARHLTLWKPKLMMRPPSSARWT